MCKFEMLHHLGAICLIAVSCTANMVVFFSWVTLLSNLFWKKVKCNVNVITGPDGNTGGVATFSLVWWDRFHFSLGNCWPCPIWSHPTHPSSASNLAYHFPLICIRRSACFNIQEHCFSCGNVQLFSTSLPSLLGCPISRTRVPTHSTFQLHNTLLQQAVSSCQSASGETGAFSHTSPGTWRSLIEVRQKRRQGGVGWEDGRPEPGLGWVKWGGDGDGKGMDRVWQVGRFGGSVCWIKAPFLDQSPDPGPHALVSDNWGGCKKRVWVLLLK